MMTSGTSSGSPRMYANCCRKANCIPTIEPSPTRPAMPRPSCECALASSNEPNMAARSANSRSSCHGRPATTECGPLYRCRRSRCPAGQVSKLQGDLRLPEMSPQGTHRGRRGATQFNRTFGQRDTRVDRLRVGQHEVAGAMASSSACGERDSRARSRAAAAKPSAEESAASSAAATARWLIRPARASRSSSGRAPTLGGRVRPPPGRPRSSRYPAAPARPGPSGHRVHFLRRGRPPRCTMTSRRARDSPSTRSGRAQSDVPLGPRCGAERTGMAKAHPGEVHRFLVSPRRCRAGRGQSRTIATAGRGCRPPARSQCTALGPISRSSPVSSIAVAIAASASARSSAVVWATTASRTRACTNESPVGHAAAPRLGSRRRCRR